VTVSFKGALSLFLKTTAPTALATYFLFVIFTDLFPNFFPFLDLVFEDTEALKSLDFLLLGLVVLRRFFRFLVFPFSYCFIL
jgi:hypothetical protein